VTVVDNEPPVARCQNITVTLDAGSRNISRSWMQPRRASRRSSRHPPSRGSPPPADAAEGAGAVVRRTAQRDGRQPNSAAVASTAGGPAVTSARGLRHALARAATRPGHLPRSIGQSRQRHRSDGGLARGSHSSARRTGRSR
jgi:hypothetical protein